MPVHEHSAQLLADLGFSSPHMRFAAWNLLALGRLGPDDPWSRIDAAPMPVNKGIMEFIRHHHHKEYQDNTRESFRKALRDMEANGLVVRNPGDSSIAVHSKNNVWALAPTFTKAVSLYDSKTQWRTAIGRLKGLHGPESLRGAGQAVLQPDGSPLRNPTGLPFLVSANIQGTLIKHVVEQLLPSLGKGGAALLYASSGGYLPKYVDLDGLEKAGLDPPFRENNPDVIALGRDGTAWFVECVETSGHVTEQRRTQRMGLIRKGRAASFVTAFEARRHAKMPLNSFASGSHIWIASEAGRGLLTV